MLWVWGTNLRYTQQRREGRVQFRLETKEFLPLRVQILPYRYLGRGINIPELWFSRKGVT
jgi:hypothetical protein